MNKLLAMALLGALTSSCTGSAGEPRSASLAGHLAARSDTDRTAAAVLYRAQSAYEDGDRADDNPDHGKTNGDLEKCTNWE